MCLGLSVSQLVKHGKVRGLNPSVDVHDGKIKPDDETTVKVYGH